MYLTKSLQTQGNHVESMIFNGLLSILNQNDKIFLNFQRKFLPVKLVQMAAHFKKAVRYHLSKVAKNE